MLIDWFTVGAQALNFLILVWLMKRFLYKPILNAIDAREQLIAKELSDADAKKSEAGKERDDFAKKNTTFDQDRAELLKKATEEAKTERDRLVDEAKKAADALGRKRLGILQSDARNLHAAISRRTQDEVFAIARKILSDLATASLEERLVAAFERKIRELDERTRSTLRNALTSGNEPALVRSAYDLPHAQRETVQSAINILCSADVNLRFETSPDVISGIELTVSGTKVSWSIAEYLSVLEKAVGDLLQKLAKPSTHEDNPEQTDASETDHPGAKPQPKTAPAPHANAKSKSSSGDLDSRASTTPPTPKPLQNPT